MVFLFVPNIIGYARVLLLFPLLIHPLAHPLFNILAYILSQTLDAFDGMAARFFHQQSLFGAVLDMVTDRFSNAILLAILGSLYPSLTCVFYGDIALDLMSHWYQMYATLACKEQHHKKAKNKFWLLDLYYQNKLVLGGLVFGNELLLCASYLLHFYPEQRQILQPMVIVGAVLFGIKKLMSVLQLVSASIKLGQLDQSKRSRKGQ